jgi:hypothetical protein
VKVIRHTPGLNFVRFTDPMEHGFSADVPGGWQVSGGTHRFSPIDTRPTIRSI